MKLCHVKRERPVHIISAKCTPSADTHASIFWRFFQAVGNFCPNFTCLSYFPIYARIRIFIQLSPTVIKLCHIKCVSADGRHVEHMMVVSLNMA